VLRIFESGRRFSSRDRHPRTTRQNPPAAANDLALQAMGNENRTEPHRLHRIVQNPNCSIRHSNFSGTKRPPRRLSQAAAVGRLSTVLYANDRSEIGQRIFGQSRNRGKPPPRPGDEWVKYVDRQSTKNQSDTRSNTNLNCGCPTSTCKWCATIPTRARNVLNSTSVTCGGAQRKTDGELM